MLEYFAIVLVFALACGAVLVFIRPEGVAGGRRCSHFVPTGDLKVNSGAPNKKWEVLFWGTAIAIFVFAGCVMIFVSHFR
jgi:hypothetical protein